MPTTKPYVAWKDQPPGARAAHKKAKRESEALEPEPKPKEKPRKQSKRHKKRHPEEYEDNAPKNHASKKPRLVDNQHVTSSAHGHQLPYLNNLYQSNVGNGFSMPNSGFMIGAYYGQPQMSLTPSGNNFPNHDPSFTPISYYGQSSSMPNISTMTNGYYNHPQIPFTPSGLGFPMANPSFTPNSYYSQQQPIPKAGFPTNGFYGHPQTSITPPDNSFPAPNLSFPSNNYHIYQHSKFVFTGNTFPMPNAGLPSNGFYVSHHTTFNFGQIRGSADTDITVPSTSAELNQASQKTQGHIIKDSAIGDHL